MTDAGRTLAAKAEGLLVAPDGRSTVVSLAPTRAGHLGGSVPLPAEGANMPGLWELQVFASADGVPRDARTAFAVAAPTAKLDGTYAVNAPRLRVALPLQAASPGRYEVRGTLFATNRSRALQPVAQAHSAAWFEPGSGILVLDFNRAELPAGYGAPFELRNLELHDQTRVAPLELRGRGLRF